ncbi:MAG: hypothetical protein K2W82_17040 [Candidatus Obscuribacterales bacterium]|nr:hypothetical protein [Candidatus Obscuribacterales bacterium]
MSHYPSCYDDTTEVGRALIHTLLGLIAGLSASAFSANIISFLVIAVSAAFVLTGSSRMLHAMRRAGILGIFYFGFFGAGASAIFGWAVLGIWLKPYMLAYCIVYGLSILVYLYRRQYAYPTD